MSAPVAARPPAAGVPHALPGALASGESSLERSEAHREDSIDVPTAREAQDLEAVERAALIFQLRCCRLVRRTFLLTPLLLVFAVSVVSAILNWQRHGQFRASSGWAQQLCLVVRWGVARDPNGPATGTAVDSAWRAEVTVRDYGLENASREVVAYFGADDAYRDTSETAARKLSWLAPRPSHAASAPPAAARSEFPRLLTMMFNTPCARALPSRRPGP
jgi:hypothetical protein